MDKIKYISSCVRMCELTKIFKYGCIYPCERMADEGFSFHSNIIKMSVITSNNVEYRTFQEEHTIGIILDKKLLHDFNFHIHPCYLGNLCPINESFDSNTDTLDSVKFQNILSDEAVPQIFFHSEEIILKKYLLGIRYGKKFYN